MKFHYLSFLNLLIFPSVILCFIAGDGRELWENEVNCTCRSGITKDELEDVRTNRKIPQTLKMGNYSLCMLQKYNVIFPNETVNLDESKYSILRDAIDETLYPRCKSQGGADFSEKVRNIFSCFWEAGELVMHYKQNDLEFKC